jgi:glycerol-3-phosphate O-acyltransferase / dihydroxyacetone phosphate acyltransferase
MTWWLAALAGPTFLAVWVAGLVDLVRRGDLAVRWRVAWAAAIVLVTPLGAALYVLTRPVPVDRVVVGRSEEPAGLVTPADAPLGLRALQQIARMASRGLFRSVEVVRPAEVATTGPQIWLASHFGAFSDPIVLLHALERRPRFLAKHTLWDIPVAGRILDAAGAIPVRRRHEGGGGPQAELFEACERALQRGEALCVFPEGMATDRTSLAPLRSGAARIALGARARGVTGQQLVATGIHFEDKAALRRRVFVEIAGPLDLDAWLTERDVDPAAASAEDRELVGALTAELEHRLREVAPEFHDPEEAAALHAAARIARVDERGRPPRFAVEADLADELGRRPAEQRAELVDAVETYRAELDAVGLTDRDVVARPRRSRRRLLLDALVGLVLLPAAVAGIVVHAPLWALVRGTGLLRLRPIAKASLRPLIAVLGALATWIAWAWISSSGASGLDRAGAVLTWLLVLPVWGAAALVVTERLWLLVGIVRRRRPGRRATNTLDAVRADRARVVVLVDGGSGDTHASGEEYRRRR